MQGARERVLVPQELGFSSHVLRFKLPRRPWDLQSAQRMFFEYKDSDGDDEDPDVVYISRDFPDRTRLSHTTSTLEEVEI
jgi:hypothetical protein